VTIKRRDFISLLAGAAAAWPLAARAQQGERLRRVGVLASEQSQVTQNGLKAFKQALEALGWSERRNLHLEYRFATGRLNQFQPFAKELVASQPEAILAVTTSAAQAIQRESKTIPVVFIYVGNPIDAGLASSLAHPGGNSTGIMTTEEGIMGKLLAMLRELAPDLRRVAIMGNRELPAFAYFLRSAESAAASIPVDLVPTDVTDATGILKSLEAFARIPNGGFLATPSSTLEQNRELIIALAAQYRLPAVYPERDWVDAGGLVSYGSNLVDQWRQSAYFIDQILRGAKPDELPVQTPTKYESAINLKTAKALGLTVPPSLLAAADEVIE
jgi:putative ABC transport system substrate-binding protein